MMAWHDNLHRTQRWSILWWKSRRKTATSCRHGFNLLWHFMQTLWDWRKQFICIADDEWPLSGWNGICTECRPNKYLFFVGLLSVVVNWSSVKCCSTRPQLGPKSKLSDPCLQEGVITLPEQENRQQIMFNWFGLSTTETPSLPFRLSHLHLRRSPSWCTFPVALAIDSTIYCTARLTVRPNFTFIEYLVSSLVAWVAASNRINSQVWALESSLTLWLFKT